MRTQSIHKQQTPASPERNDGQHSASNPLSWKRATAVVFCTAIIGLTAWAQTQTPQTPPAQAPQSKSSTDPKTDTSRPSLHVVTQMVQVDVIAKDRDGNPVTDLKQSDFTLYDNGKKQEIAWFSLETDKTKNQPAMAVSPNTYSNLVEQKTGVPGNLTIILLDFLNTKHSDVVSARSQVIKMLHQMKPGDRVAVYVLAGRLYVLHDFTNDTDALTRAVQNYETTESADLIDSTIIAQDTQDMGDDNLLNQASQFTSDFANVDRMFETTQVFEIISQHMVRVPGRKNLIWVSGSFPFSIDLDYDHSGSLYSQFFAGPGALSKAPVTYGVTTGMIGGAAGTASLSGGPLVSDPQAFGEQIQKATRALANANIAMYPVDAHGLVAPTGTYNQSSESSISGTSMETMAMIGGDPATTPGSMLSTSFDTMHNLAEHTGGLVFASTNDIGGAVKRAMDDGRVSYMLAYYPSLDDGKGKFHDIKLKVNRPGVSIRYRNGYYPEPLNYTGVTNTNPIIREAIVSPLDATGLGFTVHANPIKASAAKTLGLTLDMQQGDISFKYEDGKTMGTIKVVLAQFDTEGNEIVAETSTVKMQLSKDTYGVIRQDGLRFRRNLPIDPAAVELKIVACDDRSSAVGSVSIPLAKYFPPAGK
jgi:VWFA-related protein